MELLVLLVFKWPTYFPELCGGTRAKPGHKLEIQRMIWIWDLQGFWPYIMMPDSSGTNLAMFWNLERKCDTWLFAEWHCLRRKPVAIAPFQLRERHCFFCLCTLNFQNHKFWQCWVQLALMCDENQFEKVAGNTKRSCGRFDLFSWGHACEAYIYNPKVWLQRPENSFKSSLFFIVCFCPFLVLLMLFSVCLCKQTLLNTYLPATYCMKPAWVCMCTYTFIW